MRIISQDGMKDFNYDNLELMVTKTGYGEDNEHTIRHSSYNWQNSIDFGIYSSKEKALKVMEMIRRKRNILILDDYRKEEPSMSNGYSFPEDYFYMPQDEEV